MNVINKFIKNEYQKEITKYLIKDICYITRGRVISKIELQNKKGEYPVYSSQTLNNGVFGTINTYDFEGEYVQWTTDGANAGSIFYRNGKFSVTNICGLLKIKEEYLDKINTKYLAYVLTVYSKKYVNYATSNPKLMSNVMAKIKVAFPPLEVQEEIVRILDKFGALAEKLEVELEAELEMRKSQYDFWRWKLFNLNNTEYKVYKLCELFDNKNGYTPSKNNDSFWKNGTLPWFRMEDIRENGRILYDSIQHITKSAVKNSGLFPANSLIISTSATIGEHALIKVPFLCNQRFTCITLKDEFNKYVDMEYIYQYCFLLAEYCKKNVQRGNFNSVNMNVFKDFEFKIPSLDKQKRIVQLLNKFEKLTDSISNELSAEIELRRQQYDYYRNKLLSFE